jgi:hypothetical protein
MKAGKVTGIWRFLATVIRARNFYWNRLVKYGIRRFCIVGLLTCAVWFGFPSRLSAQGMVNLTVTTTGASGRSTSILNWLFDASNTTCFDTNSARALYADTGTGTLLDGGTNYTFDSLTLRIGHPAYRIVFSLTNSVTSDNLNFILTYTLTNLYGDFSVGTAMATLQNSQIPPAGMGFVFNGNAETVTGFTAAPEPAAWVLFGSGVLVFLIFRRPYRFGSNAPSRKKFSTNSKISPALDHRTKSHPKSE